MAFPAAPVNGDLHTEGGRNYIFRAAANAWEVQAVSGVTNLSILNRTATTLDVASSTGTDATVPVASATEAGVMSAADKTKLDAITGTNTGDQTATTVPSTAAGNLAATNVQAALQELQGDIDTSLWSSVVLSKCQQVDKRLPET